METCPECARPVEVLRFTHDAGMTYRVMHVDPLTGWQHACPDGISGEDDDDYEYEE